MSSEEYDRLLSLIEELAHNCSITSMMVHFLMRRTLQDVAPGARAQTQDEILADWQRFIDEKAPEDAQLSGQTMTQEVQKAAAETVLKLLEAQQSSGEDRSSRR